jgi:hypothetical protein
MKRTIGRDGSEVEDADEEPTIRVTEPDPRARYKADHSKTLAEAIYAAAHAYRVFQIRRARGYDGSDTLDKIDKPAGELIRLLNDPVNERRLFADEGFRAIANTGLDVVELLEDIRAAALRLHQPAPRGRPPNDELDAAYRVLADWYRREYGDGKFTRGWKPTKHLLKPSRAAKFLVDAMTLIDPKRPGLDASLQGLIENTVKSIRGKRRGRKSGTQVRINRRQSNIKNALIEVD